VLLAKGTPSHLEDAGPASRWVGDFPFRMTITRTNKFAEQYVILHYLCGVVE